VSAELPIGVTGHPLLPAEGLLLGLDERDAATDIVALAVAAGWLAGAGSQQLTGATDGSRSRAAMQVSRRP
jgi:hypothetical protein